MLNICGFFGALMNISFFIDVQNKITETRYDVYILSFFCPTQGYTTHTTLKYEVCIYFLLDQQYDKTIMFTKYFESLSFFTLGKRYKPVTLNVYQFFSQ